jgi:hypothetical protein
MELVRDELVIATPAIVRVAGRSFGVIRFQITEAGRRAIRLDPAD